MVSHLILNQHSAGVLQGKYVIPSSANFQRFCSNFLAAAGADNGFERSLLFTNEEATDFVNRTGLAWPPGPNAEQAGVVVAYDPQRNEYKPIYGIGRYNHENTVAVPGYGHPVLLSGDDTFTAPSSQLYMYSAASAAAVWNDDGSLWAFRSDDPLVNDYSDLSGAANVSGHFIPVPREIALGGQTALENWSNANNVFQFIRVEDIAHDRNDANVVYFADTGEPRALPGPGATRMTRGPAGTRGHSPTDACFKMVLDPTDETRVLSLSILIEGDPLGAASAGNTAFIHQPDNVETTGGSLLIQEDPGSQNQYADLEPGGDDRASLALRPGDRRADGRSEGQPGGRSGSGTGLVGVERDRRRIRCVRPRGLPPRCPGAHDPDGRHPGRPTDVQARGRTAHAPAHSRGLTGLFRRVGAERWPRPAVIHKRKRWHHLGTTPRPRLR